LTRTPENLTWKFNFHPSTPNLRSLASGFAPEHQLKESEEERNPPSHSDSPRSSSDGVEVGDGAQSDADAETARRPRRGRQLVCAWHARGSQRRSLWGDPPGAWPEAQMGGLGGTVLHHRHSHHRHAHGGTHGQAGHADRDVGAQAGAGAPRSAGASRGKLGFRD